MLEAARNNLFVEIHRQQLQSLVNRFEAWHFHSPSTGYFFELYLFKKEMGVFYSLNV